MSHVSDYRFEDHGSIWLCHPMTADAKDNLDEGCDAVLGTFHILWGNALVVDPRFVNDVAKQLTDEGWVVE